MRQTFVFAVSFAIEKKKIEFVSSENYEMYSFAVAECINLHHGIFKKSSPIRSIIHILPSQTSAIHDP